MLFWWLFLTLALRSKGLSHPSSFGRQSFHVATQLTFDLTSNHYDCYHQNFQTGTKLHLTVRLINLAGLNVHMAITSPNHMLQEIKQGLNEVDFKVTLPESGDYQMCLRVNRPYGQTRVTFQIFGYQPEEFNAAIREVQDRFAIHRGIQNNTQNMFKNTFDTWYHLRRTNYEIARDIGIQERNGEYVQKFSLFQCCVVLACSFTQVYVIRKFFDMRNKKMFRA